MLSPDSYQPRASHLPIAILGAAILTSCMTAPSQEAGTAPPGAAYVTQYAGRIIVDFCFTTPNGAVVTIDPHPTRGFYAGSNHLDISPQLVQASLPGPNLPTAFGSESPTTVPAILDQIHSGALQLYTQPYRNTRVSIDCEQAFPGSVPNNFIDNVAVVDWDSSTPPVIQALLAPKQGAYEPRAPYDTVQPGQ